MLVPVSVTAFPRPAHAVLGFADFVLDIPNTFQNIIQNISSAASAASNSITAGATLESAFADGSIVAKEYGLDMVVNIVIDAAIDSIMQSIINWANNGFEGSPAFVTNFREHMRNLGDVVANNFVNELLAGNIVEFESPFLDSIAGSIEENYLRLTEFGAYVTNNPYTLNRYSANDRAFSQGDFSQGGFQAWTAAWSNCNNNVFCAYSAARNELSIRIGRAETNRVNELGWGDGFRSNCAPAETTTTTTTSSTTATTTEGGGETSLQTTNAEQGPDCRTQTPNSLSNDITKRVMSLGLDRYVQADELNEVVSAVIGGLVNRVLTEGFSNVGSAESRARATGSAGSGGGAANVIPTLLKNLQDMREKVVGYQEDWEKIQSVAEPALARCSTSPVVMNAAEDAEEALEKAETSLEKIDELIAKFETASASTSITGAELSALSDEYNALSILLPSGAEIARAERDSTESASDADAIREGIPVSLYSQLKNVSQGGACPVAGS